MEEEILLTAQPEHRDQRLDRYVSDQIDDLSRSMARRLIDEAQILVNGQSAKPSAAIQPGDVVAVRRPAPAPVAIEAEDIPLQVAYEDDDLVVIDKPAGMVVHPAPGHSHGTLVNAVLARYPGISVGGELRPGIVHRLDRDTSGLLVIARNDAALHGIQEQQLARTMDKRYLLVAEGRFKQQEGVVDAPIARHPTDRLRMAIVASGREARTHWRVLEELAEYTLVEAKLETGRTHQIRVHFAHQHRPVLGDALYGPKRPKALFGLQRQFLHAYQLAFTHPRTGEPVRCESPLPPDLAAALEKLRARAR